MKAIRAPAIAAALIVLSGCGGGGGGNSTAPEAPFSFGAVQPNQTVVLDAMAVTLNTSIAVDGAGNATVTSADFTPEAAGTVQLRYDGSTTLAGIAINTPQPNSSVSFDQGSPGHEIRCGSGVCVAENPTAAAVSADPLALGWNYQTFGVWGVESSMTSAVFGALSAGSPTPASAVPTTGTATFNGITAGFYVDGAGTPYGMASTLTADVNFSSRSIQFQTSDMRLINANTGAESTRADLRVGGELGWSSGVNRFSGTVTTQNGALTGSAAGRFYGPAAEEMGGVYALSGTRTERMIGGFGARQSP